MDNALAEHQMLNIAHGEMPAEAACIFDVPIEAVALPDPSDRYYGSALTRHIDRILFKLREMRGAGLVTVKYLGTEENTADIFTKILDRQPFEKHRKTVLNTAANDGVPSARDKKAMGAWPRRF